MITVIVDTYEGSNGFYSVTDEQLRKQEQPSFSAPFDTLHAVVNAVASMVPEGELNKYLSYGQFWQGVREAGIEVQEEDEKPHRLPMKVEVSEG